MSIPKLYDHKKYMHKSTSATPTTKGDMYQLFDNYGTITENMVAVTLWQPATAYTAGAVVKSPSLPTGYVARCKTAGTSSEEEPSWQAGDITDNGVTWTVTKAVLVADLATDDEAKTGTATDKIITASALKAAIDAAIAQAKTDIEKQAKLDAHPVGSYYFSDDSTSPATLFGGTWEALPAGYGLVAQSTATAEDGSTLTFTAGQKTGEFKHQLTVGELAKHSHGQNANTDSPAGYVAMLANFSSYNEEHPIHKGDGVVLTVAGHCSNKYSQIKTDDSGAGQPHNNIAPCISAYLWQRTV